MRLNKKLGKTLMVAATTILVCIGIAYYRVEVVTPANDRARDTAKWEAAKNKCVKGIPHADELEEQKYNDATEACTDEADKAVRLGAK